jgi:uncharacterized protein YndB with AHSA1/START domain
MTDGTIEQRDGTVTFRYERTLAHPIEAVWRAITDPEAVAGWMGNRPEIELRPGGSYVSVHQGGQRVVDRVLRVEPPRLFAHTFWEQVNPSAVVTWELNSAGDGCRIVLTHSLRVEDLASAAATVAAGDDLLTILSRNAAGWHRLLDQLAARLDDREAAWSREAQQRLQQHYAALVG